MFESIRSLIEQYDTIILHRHAKPDGDAIGSQIGLKHLILDNFPDKRVFAVGDGAGRYAFMEDSTPDEALRRELFEFYEREGKDALFEELRRVDAESANT